MATRTRARRSSRARGAARGRGKPAPSGPRGLLNRVTSTLGRTSGRGGGIRGKAANFVRGFVSGGGANRRGRRRR
jgi:hypothetical protein